MIADLLYGCAAEFEDPGKLVAAARAVREAGYTKFEAYSPYPLKELDDIVPGFNPIPALVFAGGVTGALTAWLMQYYIAAFDFPTNIGGRPLYSWPSFVPITFEFTVLFASAAAFFGALWLCGLPLPHHPMFNLQQFGRVTNDRFFLCIEARDRKFYREKTYDFLSNLDPLAVWEIEND
jgi:Protein of unknown function (DUF3341)